MAKQPGAFEFPTARWKNIEKVFPVQAADAIRHAPQRILDPEITDCVRSRFPRGRSDGDAIIWLDIGSVGTLPLLHNSESGIRTDQVRAVFGDTISKAIDESDLRGWEKRNGRMNTTECVKVKPLYIVAEMPAGTFIKPLLSLVFQTSRSASKNTTSSQSLQRSSRSTVAASIDSSDTYSVRFFNRSSSAGSVSHRDAWRY
ncbi:uncharacterized protein BO80DRAFT_151362 [Aspergillus ibericus CBS 121593]|uniref:Uncharacterized protein n=1 Tax=Aspergillus ibericus CBS 121593 TaxID=1448316 RepID=A0A395GVI0_9EURO|nr:hypothetical protein BO80DRAFT_151362 [Aspergillus ibericus CBS 121593]RAK98697.1 hypothetical protein BO80DRAFT_151362 [Aspergillus ibericus CBS 121593]